MNIKQPFHFYMFCITSGIFYLRKEVYKVEIKSKAIHWVSNFYKRFV